MKQLLLATSLLIALPAISAPYAGLELGAPSVNGDIENTGGGSDTSLNPEVSDAVLAAFVGYQFNKSWGVELGYRQFELEDSLSTDTVVSATEYLEEEWEENVQVKQLFLMPTYTYHLNDKWKLKSAVGVTYTQYEQSTEYSTELENIYDNDLLEYETSVSQKSEQEQWGGIASVGVEYNIVSNLSIGASAKYTVDSYAEAFSVNISAVYSF